MKLHVSLRRPMRWYYGPWLPLSRSVSFSVPNGRGFSTSSLIRLSIFLRSFLGIAARSFSMEAQKYTLYLAIFFRLFDHTIITDQWFLALSLNSAISSASFEINSLMALLTSSDTDVEVSIAFNLSALYRSEFKHTVARLVVAIGSPRK